MCALRSSLQMNVVLDRRFGPPIRTLAWCRLCIRLTSFQLLSCIFMTSANTAIYIYYTEHQQNSELCSRAEVSFTEEPIYIMRRSSDVDQRLVSGILVVCLFACVCFLLFFVCMKLTVCNFNLWSGWVITESMSLYYQSLNLVSNCNRCCVSLCIMVDRRC